MKSFLSFCLVLAFAGTSLAQTYMTQVKPKNTKKWGYMNGAGDMMIAPQFRNCFPFGENGFAAIYDDKKLTFIDASGNVTTPIVKGLHLEQGKGFFDGLMAVKNKIKMTGFLNDAGELVIKLIYDDVTKFNGGFAIVRRNGVSYVINTIGEETPVAVNDMNEIKPFSEGLSPMKRSTGKYGFINTKGEVVIEAKFASVGYFSGGMAWARGDDGKIGFIDGQGAWVIKPKFTSGKQFDPVSGMARIKINDKWGYTDSEGNIIHMVESTKWENFSEGLAVGRKDDKIGYFDKNEKWVIEPQFEGGRPFKNGFASVKMNGLWGMINMAGVIVVPCEYIGIKDMAKIN